MNNKLYITNSDGVIVEEIESSDKYVLLSEGDKVIRKGVLQYLNDTTDVRYRFVKINPHVYGDMAIKYPILNKLVKYVGYMDGILSYKNGKKIEMKNIPDICDVSKSTVKRQLKGLIKDDVIHKVKDKGKTYLVMNPYVAYIGRKIYLSLYDDFKLSEHRANCEEWSK